jgi:hypothetical protein
MIETYGKSVIERVGTLRVKKLSGLLIVVFREEIVYLLEKVGRFGDSTEEILPPGVIKVRGKARPDKRHQFVDMRVEQAQVSAVVANVAKDLECLLENSHLLARTPRLYSRLPARLLPGVYLHKDGNCTRLKCERPL